MKGGIDRPLRDGMSGQALELEGQNPGELHTAGGDSQQHQALAVIHPFQHLCRQTNQCFSKIALGENFDSWVVLSRRHRLSETPSAYVDPLKTSMVFRGRVRLNLEYSLRTAGTGARGTQQS